MTVIGVLVEAEIGDQHEAVAQVVRQAAQGHLDDPGGVAGSAADRVLGRRHSEQHDRGNAQRRQPVGLLGQRLDGVLDHPGQRGDGPGLSDAFADEERGDQIRRRQSGLRHQVAQYRQPAQPAQPRHREGHGPTVSSSSRQPHQAAHHAHLIVEESVEVGGRAHIVAEQLEAHHPEQQGPRQDGRRHRFRAPAREQVGFDGANDLAQTRRGHGAARLGGGAPGGTAAAKMSTITRVTTSEAATVSRGA